MPRKRKEDEIAWKDEDRPGPAKKTTKHFVPTKDRPTQKGKTKPSKVKLSVLFFQFPL